MKCILCAFFVFSNIIAYSQTVHSTIVEDPHAPALQHTINWANREKTEYSDGDNIIRIENTGNNLVQLGYTAKLSTEKHGIILHKFDANGKEIQTNKLDEGRREFGPLPTLSTEFRHRIWMIYFRYEDKDSMRFYIAEVDRKTLGLVNTQLLYSYQQDNVGIFKMSKAMKHEPMVSISPDSSKLLIAYQDSKGVLFSAVFGETLMPLRKSIFKHAAVAENEITDACVENSGNDAVVVSMPNNSFSTMPLKGIILQNLDNKEKYQELGAGDAEGALLNAHIRNAKDNSRVYLYGDYAGEIVSAGCWLAELDSRNMRVGRPSLFPYPDDLKERVYKIGFGEKKHGNYGILDIDYELVEFEDGGLALCGNPVSRQDKTYVTYSGQSSFSQSHGYVMYFAGPIMAAFFDKGRKGKAYAMIPRNENLSLGSNGIYLPYQDKLVVIYNDYKKNINGEILEKDVHQSGGAVVHEMSLAYAVISKTGAIQERKLIAEGVSRMNCFNTRHYSILGERTVSIPSVSVDKKTDAFKVAVVTIE